MDRSSNNKSGGGRSSPRQGGRGSSRNDSHRSSSYRPGGGGRGEIRKRSRSKEGDSRNGWINDKHNDKRSSSLNHTRRVEPSSSRFKDKSRDYNKDHYRSSIAKHHNNSIERKSREGMNDKVEDRRRRSSLPSIQSPRKTKPLPVRRRSTSRSRQPIRSSECTRDIGSRNHQHHHHHHHNHRRLSPPPLPHQHHNHHHHNHHHHNNHTSKPSALDNRDNSKKRDNSSRRSRSSSDTRRSSSSRKDMTRHSSARRPSSTSAAPTTTTSSSAATDSSKENKVGKDNASSSTTTNGVFNHKRSPQASSSSSSKHKDCKESKLSLTSLSISPKKRRRFDGVRGKDDDKKKFGNNSSININHRKRPLQHHPMSISKRSRSLNSALPPPSKCSSSRIAARRKQRALSSLNKPLTIGKRRRSPLGGGRAPPSKRLHTKKPCMENGLENNSQAVGSSSCTSSLPESSSTSPSRMQSTSTSGNASAAPKVTLDDMSGNNNTADEYDELTQVEKWVRSAPDELYYDRQSEGETKATGRTQTICERFEAELLVKPKALREEAELLGEQKMAELARSSCNTDSSSSSNGGGCGEDDEDSDSSCSNDSSSSSDDEEKMSMTRSDSANRELERRKKHPRRLHEELWHNDPGLMNDGPVCRCSAKARRFGIRHGFYPGEDRIPNCEQFTNNRDRLFHYRITISPAKNFLISTPTVINHDGHEYIFEGFSIFSHYKLDLTLPACKVIRFNIKYDVFVAEEKFPESFCVKELLLFETYLFREILELVDLRYDWNEETGCSQFHLMPRFVRQLPDNGQEILGMCRVLIHLLNGDRELVKEEDLEKLYTVDQSEWQNFADRHKGTIVTKWGVKPCALRVDQIDREVDVDEKDEGIPFPLIVHFGIRPPQLSYAGNASYQRAWRRYVKYRHLLSNMPKPSPQDKSKLVHKELMLQAMRTASDMKRDVTVAIPSKGFRTTGICCDLVQHAMLIPVLIAHLRFHKCLETLEQRMEYPFQNRYLLQLAMTHPSYRENFGTNPDHARNALTNCGIRQPEYGDRRIHYASTRKRGINTLINIMAKFGSLHEKESGITHNERLEFLGDAVVEFTTSIHLFHIFPDLEEGGLATYRAAIVQNQHLAVLAQALNLDQYMLYAHGSDLCHDSELRHAMANCFEALMGALFLDGGIEAADRVFGSTLHGNDENLLDLWANYPKHPLQQEELDGDRHWIESHEVLQKLNEFENNVGIPFNHIRLLARAFTDRSLGYNNLTKGSNQRLEFLGDTVLQLISSEHLYRHFPDHHEGHLSLLRSSLVNNRTQSQVCEELGMPQYAMRGDPKSEMKTKDKADLLEAFLGALYIDKGLTHCIVFCEVCFFPRLNQSITKQEWNDPKSKLQQCCLTLRAMDGREPDIPVYKVTESLGPTNTRTYIVAVYFRGKRLATAQGHSIQEAEMNAAMSALDISGDLFPQLHHQKRIMEKTKKTH